MMDEIEARKILGESIDPTGDLYDLGRYMSWEIGDDNIVLDGRFTVKELQAIAWWMEHAT